MLWLNGVIDICGTWGMEWMVSNKYMHVNQTCMTEHDLFRVYIYRDVCMDHWS